MSTKQISIFIQYRFSSYEKNSSKFSIDISSAWKIDEDSHQQMNMRPSSEPRYNLRKRTHPQLQQHAILFLSKKFEKLTIHEVSDEDLSKPLKESVDPMGITFPPLPFII